MSHAHVSRRHKWAGCGVALFGVIALASCANGPASRDAAQTTTSGSHATTAPTSTTTTCPLSTSSDSAGTVPVDQVCGSAGAPYFTTPNTAMAYLSKAWNTGNVQELDYVTDPAGRAEMNSMAAQMVNLKFKSCTENPAGDYTCFFKHDITPTDSSTTYPNPGNYPAGEAVFTVAPAASSGWYLTDVIHCG